ncbi:hypothetical protein L249_4854 [Ophiocordyceps polyrhachis-furcata BCC 54312]|uniref:Spindle pole body component n=1 Tax=Ophiocordyceps polyrhachis-furcata BCC 54312 TaxID=1330021 RepID=A0A367L2P7_9HYPO|nr:hypothetical protein L249_4854 [Ophiocordyceps polyrhachis-furcata BCC 54312]
MLVPAICKVQLAISGQEEFRECSRYEVEWFIGRDSTEAPDLCSSPWESGHQIRKEEKKVFVRAGAGPTNARVAATSQNVLDLSFAMWWPKKQTLSNGHRSSPAPLLWPDASAKIPDRKEKASKFLAPGDIPPSRSPSHSHSKSFSSQERAATADEDKKSPDPNTNPAKHIALRSKSVPDLARLPKALTCSRTALVEQAFGQFLLDSTLQNLWPQVVRQAGNRKQAERNIGLLLRHYVDNLRGSETDSGDLERAITKFNGGGRHIISRRIVEDHCEQLNPSSSPVEPDEDDYALDNQAAEVQGAFESQCKILSHLIFDPDSFESFKTSVRLSIESGMPARRGLGSVLRQALRAGQILVENFIQSQTEQPVPPGKKRVRWTCVCTIPSKKRAERTDWLATQRCGKKLYDDYVELREGAVQDLQTILDQYYNPNLRVGDNNHPPRTPWNRFQDIVAKLGGIVYESTTQMLLPMFNQDNVAPASFGSCTAPSFKSAGAFHHGFVLLCIPYMRWATNVHHVDICGHSVAINFFKQLPLIYNKARGNQWRWWLRRVKSIEFVKFEMFHDNLVNIAMSPSIPDLPIDKRHYVHDSVEMMPPIGPNLLMHCFDDPDKMNEVLPIVLKRIPKRLGRLNVCPEKGSSYGWGLQFVEGLNEFSVVLCCSAGFVVCLVLSLVWTIVRQDGIVQWLLEPDLVQIDARSGSGLTALHCAAMYCYAACDRLALALSAAQGPGRGVKEALGVDVEFSRRGRVMAFATRLGPLVEDLVQTLTQSTAQSTSSLSDAILRKLKSHPYLRTNPFEIEDRLQGLDERFRVNNRDGLADALNQRLHSLSQHPSPWHPDVLHLLLELSDQPTFKTRLQSLDALENSRELPPEDAPLRWEEIAREDGWDRDGDLWRSPVYSNDDSDSEHVCQSSAAESSDGTSLPDDQPPPVAEDYVMYPSASEALQSVLEAQAWRTKPHQSAPCTAVPELQVVREALFMLQGFECSIFNGTADPVPDFQMADAAPETSTALIGSLAETGRRMRVLRQFVAQPQTVPHVQALQDCLCRHLADVDRKLSAMQARFASPEGEVVVSLMAVMSEIDSWVEPLLSLSDIVKRCDDASSSNAFRYLERIFDEACVAQVADKPGTYELLVRVFVECFNVYLHPVQLWMLEGKLLHGDEPFFITEPCSHVPLGDTWRSRFQIRKTVEGRPFAPSFLQPAVGNIYKAGKNMVALRLLSKEKATASLPLCQELHLDYDVLCPAGFELAPFSDLFDTAFGRWVQSRCLQLGAKLKTTVVEIWGLFTSLDSLRDLYLMAEGRAAASFCDALFARLDSTDAGWCDRYALTTAGREAFASLVDPSRLAISVDPDCRPVGSESVRAALACIKIGYRLPWPVQMIVTAESMAHYHAVFTLLLQIKRATYALHKTRSRDKSWVERQNEGQRSLFYSIRCKLLWFCATLHTYLAMQVLGPTEAQMRRDLEAAGDVDSMIGAQCSGTERMAEEACLGRELASFREKMLDVLDLAVKLEYDQRQQVEGLCLESLDDMAAAFDRLARSVCQELRGAARRSSRPASAKWDILADMLQMGVRDDR